MRKSFLFLPAAAFALALPSLAPSAPQRLEQPSRQQIAASGVIRDRILTGSRALQSQQGFWGGTYTADTGEKVTVFTSRSYPEDQATGQKWANFLAGLVHGSELSRVTVYFEPSNEVEQVCGRQALACYTPRSSSIVTVGTDPGGGITAEAVLTHEYGHHVAFNRVNKPWPAVNWGTKRWASYENVCRRTRAHELWPGAEDLNHYTQNPGEGFAEAYRVLNEQRAGIQEIPWEVVTTALYPDDKALAALEQDVVDPWTHATGSTFTGAVRAGATRSVVVPTPLDGSFRASVTGGGGFKLAVVAPSGHRLARGGSAAATTVCGQRSLRIRISAKKSAAYRLTVSTP